MDKKKKKQNLSTALNILSSNNGFVCKFSARMGQTSHVDLKKNF